MKILLGILLVNIGAFYSHLTLLIQNLFMYFNVHDAKQIFDKHIYFSIYSISFLYFVFF